MKPMLMRPVLCGMVQSALQLPAAHGPSPPPDLIALNTEDLMNIEVTSASNREYSDSANSSLIRRSAFARTTWRF